MNVMESPDQLLSNLPNVLNLQALIILDDIEKLALTQLSYQNELALCLKRIQQQDYVFVL